MKSTSVAVALEILAPAARIRLSDPRSLAMTLASRRVLPDDARLG